MNRQIRKAVFPVAGLGSRFLPVTKANPKEMLPVVDKPLIQYAVEEAYAAGIRDMIFVTGRNKRSIEDHFDRAYELEIELSHARKDALLAELRATIPADANFIYVRQGAALGLGHAVLCAAPLIHDEPFAVVLADDFLTPGALPQMVAAWQQAPTLQGMLLTLQVPLEQTRHYGIVKLNAHSYVEQMVEKPAPETAPSCEAVIGRYLLPAAIFPILRHIQPGVGAEIQLTDAINQLAQTLPISTHPCVETRFDCGSKLGYLQANIAMGLARPDLAAPLRQFLQQQLSQ